LKGVSVNKISHSYDCIYVSISTKTKKTICPVCGSETSKIHDLSKYHRITNRLARYIYHELRESVPLSFVSKNLNLSVSTITRVFDKIQIINIFLNAIIIIDKYHFVRQVIWTIENVRKKFKRL